jgi:NTE family protein
MTSSTDHYTPTGTGVVLVCSGGGLHGAAQAGMLAELFEQGFTCDAIIGVSAGACNALYLGADPTAEGADRLCEVWRSLEVADVFPTTKRAQITGLIGQRSGVARQENFRRQLAEHLPFADIAECIIPVHIGTVDVHTGEEVWFSQGPALDVLVASAALPGVFPPVVIDGRTLYDGGVVHVVPVTKALELNPLGLVALDVTKPAPTAPIASHFTTLRRGIDHTREALRQAQLAAVPSHLPLAVIRGSDSPFVSLRDEVAAGRAAMREHLSSHPLEALPVTEKDTSAVAPWWKRRFNRA